MTITWKDLDRTGPQQVRDLWRQQDIGICQEEYTTEVGRHGVALVRIIPPTMSHKR